MPHQSMMLVERAAEKPRMLKLISVAVHRASPPITGIRERFTSNPAKKKKGQPQFNCCIFNVSHAGFWENFKFWTAKKEDQAELQLFKATRLFLDRKITTMPLHQTLLNSTSSLCSHWFFQLHLFYFDGLSLIKKKKRVIKSHFRTHQCIPPISSETWWQWK